jgi:hypothetical protein
MKKCGIYQITCPTCNMKYVGQISRPFKIRFQEHLRDFKYGNLKSRFAQPLIDNGHAIGPMHYIMDVFHITRKGRMMDTLENFYIFQETELNNQINDKLMIRPNIIFETIVHHDHHRGLPNSYSQDRQQLASVLQDSLSSSQ